MHALKANAMLAHHLEVRAQEEVHLLAIHGEARPVVEPHRPGTDHRDSFHSPRYSLASCLAVVTVLRWILAVNSVWRL